MEPRNSLDARNFQNAREAGIMSDDYLRDYYRDKWAIEEPPAEDFLCPECDGHGGSTKPPPENWPWHLDLGQPACETCGGRGWVSYECKKNFIEAVDE